MIHKVLCATLNFYFSRIRLHCCEIQIYFKDGERERDRDTERRVARGSEREGETERDGEKQKKRNHYCVFCHKSRVELMPSAARCRQSTL